jgi:alpha-L-fucosidase 2
MPSQSPENRFEGTGFWPVSIGISSAMDVQLAYDSLDYAIKTSDILGIDIQEAEKWKDIRDRLPDFKIGKDGRLLEWDMERKEIEPGHRHYSNLYGLYPSDLFNPEERPKEYEAAIESLKSRVSHGGGYVGWSRAWTACFFARIGDADEFWYHMQELIKGFAEGNLLDVNSSSIFQIDGNFGAVAAVLECLVQYRSGKLHLLRALPKAWSEGSVSGIKTPGGHTLSIHWHDGKPVSVEIIMGYSGKVVIAELYNSYKTSVDMFLNDIMQKSIEFNDGDFIIRGNIGDKILIKKRKSSSS